MKTNSRYIPINGGQIYVEQSGIFKPHILWVHGLPLNLKSWGGQRQHFNALANNVLLDLRGYGKSSKLPKGYDSITDLYMDDFLRVLDAYEIEKTILIGFASAGHAALRFAALNTSRVSKLVVINGSPCFMSRDDWQGGFDKNALKTVVEMIDNANSEDDIYKKLLDASMNENAGPVLNELKAWYLTLAKTAGLDTVRAFFANIAFDDDRELLSKIISPTLLISSRLGQEVPSSTALYLRENIANSQLFELNDIDHFAYATKCNLVNQVIEQFLFPSCDIYIPNDKD